MNVFLKQFRENHIPTLSVPSQRTYTYFLSKYVEPAFGATSLGSITPLDIEKLFRAMEVAGLARNTRATVLGILRAVWACAIRWKFVDESPLKGVSVGGGPRRVHECKVPSLEDVQRLMAECDGDIPLLIETLYMTGMRISEAAGLTIANLNFVTGFFEVRQRDSRGSVGDTKAEASTRDLPMGHLLGQLQAHVAAKAPSDRVFTYRGKPIVDHTLLANNLSPRMLKLGMKFRGFGWHTFRRLHLSLMNKRGLSLFDLRRQAGHADIRTTQRYIAADAGARVQAVEELPRLTPYLVRPPISAVGQV
jgi:integrase